MVYKSDGKALWEKSEVFQTRKQGSTKKEIHCSSSSKQVDYPPLQTSAQRVKHGLKLNFFSAKYAVTMWQNMRRFLRCNCHRVVFPFQPVLPTFLLSRSQCVQILNKSVTVNEVFSIVSVAAVACLILFSSEGVSVIVPNMLFFLGIQFLIAMLPPAQLCSLGQCRRQCRLVSCGKVYSSVTLLLSFSTG